MHRSFNRLLAFSAAALLASAGLLVGADSAQAQWGNLRGRFVYDGTPPQPEKINVSKDQDVCGKHNLVDESLVVDPSSGGIQNVAIWVMTKGIEIYPKYKEHEHKTIIYDNKGCRFNPHVLPIWIKETLELHNSDPIGHNSNMAPLGDVAINPLLPPDSAAEYKFARAQNVPVPITCNIHPWMKGYVIARDNPYTAISTDDGTFEIKNLPVGEIEFRVWQEKSGYVQYDDWNKGRFKYDIKDGDNDLGTMKLSPDQFNK